MERWTIHWQDVVAMVAGAWLIVTVMAQISTVTFFSGWLFFLCGAALLLVGAATLQDEAPGPSWAMAAAAALVVLTPFITGITDATAATFSAVIAGLIALGMSVWSALNKRDERRRRTRVRRRRLERTTA